MKRSVQDILNKPYARVLIRNDDGRSRALILDVRGCGADGATPDEAIDDLDKAASSWIQVALMQNDRIPKPLASYGYSGKINLRIPKSIHKQSARIAQRDDVSLNQFFLSSIAASVGAEEFCERLMQRMESWIKTRLPPVPYFVMITPAYIDRLGMLAVADQAQMVPSAFSRRAITLSSETKTQQVIAND
jgi:antitoxin HicB